MFLKEINELLFTRSWGSWFHSGIVLDKKEYFRGFFLANMGISLKEWEYLVLVTVEGTLNILGIWDHYKVIKHFIKYAQAGFVAMIL